MSLGKLAPGGHEYYVEVVAKGAEEYYVGAREAPGTWIGAASGRLGLEGEVDAEVLERILRHTDPSGVYRLTAAHSVPTVAAYDATFCAPKSVSLLFALGRPEVSNEVRNAQDASVVAGLEVLERVACRGRRGKGGATLVDGDGFVAASFRHRTSRAADPHLHTHVLIANLVHAPVDGRWTALDGRPVFTWLQTAGFLYDAQLRWELTRRLGVEWGAVGKTGTAEIDGVSSKVVRAFSIRRREIEAHMNDRVGANPQIATYATRRAKDPDLDPASLLPEWRERAERHGFDDGTLAGLIDRSPTVEPPVPGSIEAELMYGSLAGPVGLTERASTFGDRDVIKAICAALPAGAPVERVLALAEGFLRSGHVVALVGGDRGDVIRRTDGTTVAAHSDGSRWTTPDMLDVERRLLATAERVRGTGAGLATATALDTAVAGRTLSDEQEAMVRRVCSSGDGVDVVVGIAGSGKTYALGAARDAWHRSGFTVVGCSLAARAAKQLQDDAGIPSITLTRVLGDIERHRLTVGDTAVIVVDEAGMVGTRALARLVEHATAAGAKVLLVGDPGQLPEIDAGGAFRGLRARLGAAELTENRRQTEPWEPAVLAQLRSGNTDQAIDAYLDHERVHVAATQEAVRDDLVNAWSSGYFDDEDVLMVAARLADVDDLNRRARNALRTTGCLGPDEIVLGGRPYATGDEVLALRNDYAAGVLNGTRAELEQIDGTRQQLALRTASGETLSVPFAYAEAGHLTHGYATTIHKAQGATVDRCLVLVDDTMSREHAYTALSRGRQRNDLFVVAEDRRAEERHAAEVVHDPLDDLRRTVGRTGGKRMAVDETTEAPTDTLERLRRDRDEIRTRLGDRPPDPSRSHRQLTEAHTRARHDRDGAQWRLDTARTALHDLGPIGRRTHRTERRELEKRIVGFEADIARHDQKLAALDTQLTELAPDMKARSAWEREHRLSLDRLDTLDRQITLAERIERNAARALERSLERDRGMELGRGIEL
ncbi:MAG: relaxase domain-containing protein [Acidimicrobiia bacterium]|nr:relaxase domain-containing protein [Acidimicrobiia bacterium]